jgi:hypothetical protein
MNDEIRTLEGQIVFTVSRGADGIAVEEDFSDPDLSDGEWFHVLPAIVGLAASEARAMGLPGESALAIIRAVLDAFDQ